MLLLMEENTTYTRVAQKINKGEGEFVESSGSKFFSGAHCSGMSRQPQRQPEYRVEEHAVLQARTSTSNSDLIFFYLNYMIICFWSYRSVWMC